MHPDRSRERAFSLLTLLSGDAKLRSASRQNDRPFDGAVVAFYPVRMYRGLREAALLRRGGGDGWRDRLSKVTELEVERDLQSAGAGHRRRARDPEVTGHVHRKVDQLPHDLVVVGTDPDLAFAGGPRDIDRRRRARLRALHLFGELGLLDGVREMPRRAAVDLRAVDLRDRAHRREVGLAERGEARALRVIGGRFRPAAPGEAFAEGPPTDRDRLDRERLPEKRHLRREARLVRYLDVAVQLEVERDTEAAGAGEASRP